MAVAEYLSQLQKDKKALVKNLFDKGVEVKDNETFTTLVPKVATIETASPIEEQIIIEPNTDHRIYLPAEGYDGIARVEALPVTSDIDINIQPKNIKEGVSILGVTGNYDGVEDLELQYKTVNPTSEEKGIDITYDSNYDALGGVHINPIKASMVRGLSPDIIKRGEKVLEMTGTYGETSQIKAVYPSTSQVTVYPDEGVKFLEKVIVQPVDRGIDDDIQAANIKMGVEILGVTGTYTGDFTYQNKTAYLTTEEPVTYTADEGYDALSSVTVPRVTAAIDGNISSGNIRKGVEILGVTGTYEPAPSMTNKSVSPKTYVQYVTPDSGYGSMDQVTVGAVTASIDSDIKASNIKSGIEILGVKGTLEYMEPETVNVHPSIERQEILPGEGYNCINKVIAHPVTNEIDTNIIASNIKEGIDILGITGTYSGEAINLQEKTVQPIDSIQSITADDGYDALSTVTVNVPEMEDIEVNPSIEEYTVNKKSNKYIRSVTVNPVSSDIDKNIRAENIRKNMSILGVVGNYEGEDPLDTYVNGVEKGAYNESFRYSHDLNYNYTYYTPGILKHVIKIPGTLPVVGTSMMNGFENMTNLIEGPNIDLTNVTTCERIFNGCSSLSYVPPYNTPNVTSWYMAFGGCKKLTAIPDCDFSNTTSTSLMFVDGGITEIPTNFMERFPKLISMTNMFYGCPLGGDLTLTLGSEYTAVGTGRKLGIGGFCNDGVYNNITLNLASNISCYGSGSSNYLRYSGLPTGKVSTKVNLLDGGQIETYSYVSVPCSDSVYYSINSDENFTVNLPGCLNADRVAYQSTYSYAPGIKFNFPDVKSLTYFFYYADRCTGPIYLHVGPNCTSISYMLYYSTAPSLLRYSPDKPVIDGSSITSVNKAFYQAKKLVDFEGITNLGKGYTYKSHNYSDYTLDLSYCTALSVESLRSIINNLYDLNQNATYVAAGTIYRQSLKLGSTNLAKLTDEEKAVATNKGWNLS